MNMAASGTEAEIWDRTVEPQNGDLPPEAARAWLKLQLSPGDRERVNELSAKARADTLSDGEERELDGYLNVGRALELLKAKARLSLRHGPPAE
jgi:hypothetical protein